ncbi:nucleotide exchange factor GrpE [Paenibacillus sp. P2(2022)]|uniref:Protein GrpE n=1 Tax=Paenibacillus polymyxa TaxID=1406 RepID=A0A378Y374_PAEPO|nr:MULTISPECIES: nucleotide exchange factor GrpE [Paenibacillus]MEB4782670.1 nucleotide exchange factor GrpE [Paenibacillus jamilae]AUS27657.1 molecular chaperone GrpE [Paenibacillus polymyxa]KAF6585837.1 nucleotide exchange factor GrpE [Paenibacillus sp. EKM211P]KJK31449.1 molecular chaperone GrpE [Paenibacillus polymyxa]MBE7896846.1 nucleotide exchange factor GrpE [Paenibacillus polymyxa]
MKEEQAFQDDKQQNVSTEEAAETSQQDELVNEAAALEAEEENTEVAKLRAEAEEHQQRFLRAQADFDNFRRRTLKEKEDLAKYASMKLVTELVPVLDNFERALATASQGAESESFTKGVEMIFRQFESVLQAEGVTAMNAVGQPFNPDFHQAIMQVESEEHDEGIVVEEVQKGYMLKDKVLRPAMVKVSM